MSDTSKINTTGQCAPFITGIDDPRIEIDIVWNPERLPIRGNYVSTGDADLDREMENELIEILESGNKWAWCVIEVIVEFNGFIEREFIGACSFDNKEQFIECGHYDDLIQDCIDRINRSIREAHAIGNSGYSGSE